MTYFEMVRPTYIENWPAELCGLSVAQADVPLTLDEARALGSNIFEYGETFARVGGPVRPLDISGIRFTVAATVERFPHGAFVRLGSRSPKDAWSWCGERPGMVLPGEDPLRFLLDCSERVSDDLHLALANGYPPHVFVRQWVDIPAWSEFRCFRRGGELVGVSQYKPRACFPELGREASIIRWAVGCFYGQFAAACRLRDVVFDVFVKVRRRGNEADAEVKLVEINPFGEFTDPCLFCWTGGGDFDGTFRYLDGSGAVTRERLGG